MDKNKSASMQAARNMVGARSGIGKVPVMERIAAGMVRVQGMSDAATMTEAMAEAMAELKKNVHE
jgi:hypothetical protein